MIRRLNGLNLTIFEMSLQEFLSCLHKSLDSSVRKKDAISDQMTHNRFNYDVTRKPNLCFFLTVNLAFLDVFSAGNNEREPTR